MWQLIRLPFLYWRRQKQRFVERISQVSGCLNISAQICNHNLVVYGNSVLNPGAISGQRDVDDTVRESKCGGNFIKNEWGVRGVANLGYNPYIGTRIGVICHDGTFLYWEWDNAKGCFVPLIL
jgi:hypothetical protein